MATVTSTVTQRRTKDDAGLDELRRAVDGAEVWIGIASAKDPDSEIVRYATKNEFGSVEERIPERSFMRSTADEQAQKYARMAAKALQQTDRASFMTQLELLGVVAVGDVQLKIVSDVPPPNAPMTIARKGSTGTLRDSGRMLQSIKHETIAGDER